MLNYLALMKEILETGEQRNDRTGTGTLSLFGRQLKFDLGESFPAVTTKKLFFRGVVAELLWMMSGSTNVRPLQEQGVNIWDEWADEEGELGPVYGAQWREWETVNGKTIDQLASLMDSLSFQPYSRRHILSSWNVGELEYMALPPCHMVAQFQVTNLEGPGAPKLHCMMTQRSCDYFLGAPFNIAQYALLTCLMGHTLGYEPGELTINFGDVHIYLNHVEQCWHQLKREPKALPKLVIKEHRSLFDYRAEDFALEGYDPHPSIKGAISV